MPRSAAVFLLTTLAMTGCANMQRSTTDYCLVPSGSPCAEVGGAGDCQPCPTAQSPLTAGT
jgi:hypothetical protein